MTGDSTTDRQRYLFRLAETYHAIVYYAEECSTFGGAGLKGWWRAYFATRAAPLGNVPVEVVVATFYNFAPRMVRRALPAAWEVIAPSRLIDLRFEVVSAALDRVLRTDPAPVEGAAELALRAVEDLQLAGRPLYAAHRAVPAPGAPPIDLWHACTLLREYRFDGHNAALMAHEVGGCASHVMMAAWGRGNMETILPIRGFSEDEWRSSADELRDRGWLDDHDRFTVEGAAVRQAIEDMTDRLCRAPLEALGPQASAQLIEVLEPLAERVRRLGPVPVGWPPPHLLRPAAGTDPPGP